MDKRTWYPLDNAANIYPVIANRNFTPMFRYTAELASDVDTAALQRALDAIRPRLPGFFVRLRRGLFWYYLEHTDAPALVEEDTHDPCPPLHRGDLPVRVKVYRNRISCEFAHLLCDGGGAMVFLKTLLAEYFRQAGVPVPASAGVLPLDEVPHPEETEDGFSRFSRMGAQPSRAEQQAYHPTGTRLLPGTRIVTTGTVSVKAMLALARESGVSLTEYLTATLVYVLYRMQIAEHPKRLRPVKISVPINLRKYYPTRTLRNFSQYLNPGIDPNYGEFTFEETLEQVHHYFRFMFTEKNMNARISKNVGSERNMALRVVPLFIKKFAIHLIYNLTGERLFSSVISNLGAVELPVEIAPYVKKLLFVLCTAKRNAVECGVVSLGDTLTITFTRIVAEPHVERTFFRALVQKGLLVTVESNQN